MMNVNNSINEGTYNEYLGKIQKLALFIFFVGIFNLDIRNQFIWWGIHTFLILVFILYLIKNNYSIKTYTIVFVVWYLVFTMFSIFSSMWALDINYSLEEIKRSIVNILSLFCISIMITSKYNLLTILKIFVFSNLINAFYIINKIGFSHIFYTRIGYQSLGDGWNSNSIGIVMAITAFIAFFLFSIQIKSNNKFLYFGLSIFFIIIVLLTGSRTSFILSLLMIAIYWYLKTRKKILATIIVLLGMLLLFYIILTTPIFYEVIGYRLEPIINRIIGKSYSMDSSSLERREMIYYGVQWIKEKPIFGYGINNFRKLYGSLTGYYTYSHNNYIELLVNLGIVGTILYYSSYIYILIKSICNRSEFQLFSFVAITSLLLGEIAMVNYFRFHVLFMICIAFSAISISKDYIVSN